MVWFAYNYWSHNALKIVLANEKPLWPLSIQKLPSILHAPNELISAVVDLSNLTRTASQLLTAEGLEFRTLYHSTSVLEISKLEYKFI